MLETIRRSAALPRLRVDALLATATVFSFGWFGNTLIADYGKKRVIEVTPKGEIVWEYKHGQQVHDADRLPNGNTLIAIYTQGKIIEVTPKGKVVRQLKGLMTPIDADRLPNGHTLVAQRNEISEYDAKGKKIWSMNVTYPGEVNRY